MPAKAEARSALVGFARTLTLGLPAHAIAGVSTALVTGGTGPAQRQMLGTKQPLPDVSELMEISDGVLRRHRTMTQIRGRRTEPSPPSDDSPGSDEASQTDAARTTGATDGSEGGMGAKLGGMKDWLKRRMDDIKPLWSEAGSVLGHDPDAAATSGEPERAPPAVGPWTPEQIARYGQRNSGGRELHNAEALGGGVEGRGVQDGATIDLHAEADAEEVTGGDAVQGGEAAAEVDLCERCFIAIIGDSYQVGREAALLAQLPCCAAVASQHHAHRWRGPVQEAPMCACVDQLVTP